METNKIDKCQNCGFEGEFLKPSILDPFAGGCVRGVLASLLGQNYVGIELNPEQVEANDRRLVALNLSGAKWINDDSLNVDLHVADDTMDFVFSCPPYGDLEQYTDDPRDLSNMSLTDFLCNYYEIIYKAKKKLKQNRFAVFVVGDYRDKDGFYTQFVRNTIDAFTDADTKLYNEIILLNNIGTAPMRANQNMRNRKVVKLHQNVLVFYKGNPDEIQKNYTEIDSGYPFIIPNQGSLF